MKHSTSFRKKFSIILMIAFCSFQMVNAATLNLTLFLQGYYVGPGMNSPLFNLQLSATNYNVDSIDVKLLNPTSYVVVESIRVMLHSDGTCQAVFTNGVVGNSYYIDICHRNTIQTMSKFPVLLNMITSYNFSTAAAKAFGDNMIEVSPGVWAFYTGDLNHDCVIDGADFLILDPDIQAGAGGYRCTDLNGDGGVDGLDALVIDPNIQNGVGCSFPGPIPTCSSCGGDPCTNANIDDGNACTTDACNTMTGAITHTAVNVNDNNA